MKSASIVLFLCAAAAGQTQAQESAHVQPVLPAEEGVIAAAQDVPFRFDAVKERQPPKVGERPCPIEYSDPRDGTTLRLMRSVTSRITNVEGNRRVTTETSYGDYFVAAPNRYGIEAGRALRIDCVSRRPVGVVRRFD